jgi:hypothetical protein
MYLGDPNQWMPPPADPPRGGKGQERVLGWLIGLNLVLLLLAPIGGATLLQPLLAWLSG